MQLENKRQELEKQGIAVAAISYDSVAVLNNFAKRKGVHYPLLSDTGSKIIRAFGILNDTVPEDDKQFYGIPNPGEYLLDPSGVVKSKFFEDNIRDRFTAGTLLVRQGASPSGKTARTIEADHLTVTSWVSDDVVFGGNRFALALEIDLPDKMHVYAPGVEGYIPIEWTMDEADQLTVYDAEYPEPEMLHLPAINETVPVYQGKFRIVRDVMIGQPQDIAHLLDSEGNVVLKGELRYQACDDKVCYIPQTVPLVFSVKLGEHDRTRVPEALRKID